MPWCKFTINLGKYDSEAIEKIFKNFNVCSITYSNAGNNPVFARELGETKLWTESSITGIFPDNLDQKKFKKSLTNALSVSKLINFKFETLEDRIWEREWLKDFKPMKFGKHLWVHPTEHITQEENKTIVYLDPGLAFGTGTHATTALCLEWIDSQILESKRFLDFGCGSGILAIAALKLGSSSATAFDIDPQAIIATRQNAIKNRVNKELNITGNMKNINEGFDVIVANILAEPLIDLAPSIASMLNKNGSLALSGILSKQINEVKLAYKHCIEFNSTILKKQDGQTWSLLLGKKIN